MYIHTCPALKKHQKTLSHFSPVPLRQKRGEIRIKAFYRMPNVFEKENLQNIVPLFIFSDHKLLEIEST